MLESPANGGFVAHMRANGHQTLQFKPVQCADFLRDANGIRRIATGFRRLARFIDFQQHTHGDAACHRPT